MFLAYILPGAQHSRCAPGSAHWLARSWRAETEFKARKWRALRGRVLCDRELSHEPRDRISDLDSTSAVSSLSSFNSFCPARRTDVRHYIASMNSCEQGASVNHVFNNEAESLRGISALSFASTRSRDRLTTNPRVGIEVGDSHVLINSVPKSLDLLQNDTSKEQIPVPSEFPSILGLLMGRDRRKDK